MNFLKSLLTQNRLTTFFGILAGAPLLVAGSGMPLSSSATHYLLFVGGAGTIGLGIVAKAFNNIATTAQAAAAQAKVEGDPRADALKKAADAQAVGK